jgi:hypothetical protein
LPTAAVSVVAEIFSQLEKCDLSMDNITQEELKENLCAITSLIGKCEKAYTKLIEDTSQHTLMKRRLKAFYISETLIKKELGDTFEI